MVTSEETDPSRRGRCVQAPKPGQGQGLLPWRCSKASLVGLAQVQCRVPQPPPLTLTGLQDSDLVQRTWPEGSNLPANPRGHDLWGECSIRELGPEERLERTVSRLPADHTRAQLDTSALALEWGTA